MKNHKQPQKELILSYLRKGKRLTVASAINYLGVYALSQRCGELRRAGVPIKSKTITRGSKHFSEYSL